MLAVEEITVKHTGLNLKTLLLDRLKTYGIYPRHIYSITSDNGSNILKMVKLMNDDYRKLKFGDIPEVDVNNETEVNDFIQIICDDDWEDDDIKGEGRNAPVRNIIEFKKNIAIIFMLKYFRCDLCGS